MLAKYSIAALVFAAALVPTASYADFIVDAQANSSSDAVAFNTGMVLSAGETYDISVLNAQSTFWSAGNDDPYSRTSTAAGIDPTASGYGTWTEDGFTANFGALVGEVDGHFFLVGTGTTITGLSGDLLLFYWDSNSVDNSGTQSVEVTPVPEPASLALLGSALVAGIGFLRRKKKPTA